MNHPSRNSNHQSPTSQLQSDGGAEQHDSNNNANNSDDPNTPGSNNESPPIKSSEEPEEYQTNNVPTVLDTKPINPIFASQDVDDKRTLYNKFNNITNTNNYDGNGGDIPAIDNVTVDSAVTRPPTHPDSKFAVDMRTAEHDSIRSIPGAFSIDGINSSSRSGTVEQVAVEVPSPPEEQQHAMWEGEGGAVHDYEVEGDVDTLGLGWDEEPNLGGAMPDSVSVAMSAITIPTVTTPMFPEQRAFVHHNSDDDEQPLATTTSLSRTTASPVITATADCSARESSVLTRHSSFDAYPEAVLVDERQAAIEAEPIDEMKQKRDEMKQKRTKILVGSIIVFLLALVSILVGVLVSSNKSKKGSDSSPPPPPDPDLDCISCIDRNSFTLRAVVHGTSDDYFWQRFATSARQSAQDMRVNLQLELYSPGEFSDKRMSDDIRAAVVDENVDALIVTIPSSKMVANAVRYAADSGMPLFGMNSGFDEVSSSDGVIEEGTILFFAAMNETQGGEIAASRFVESNTLTNYTELNALFILPSGEENSAYQQRYDGYHAGLVDAINGTNNVEWWEVDLSTLDGLDEKLSGCIYQYVLTGTGRLAHAVVDAVEASSCLSPALVGTFDTSSDIHQLVDEKRLLFAMDQQYHLQSWSPIVMATLYLQAGLVLTPPPGGVYLSGPKAVTSKTKPDEVSLICLEEAFPVCGGATLDSLSSSECPCTERNQIKIGGVVHNTFSPFWDAVFDGAEQAARDYQIELDFIRFERQDNATVLYDKMAGQILSLCESGNIDGLFVSITDEVVVDAVRKCIEMGTPIVSINAGYDESIELGLIHHIGMVEDDAGYRAGVEMVKTATFSRAACLNHWPLNPNILQRCAGFERAMKEAGIDIVPQILVPADDSTLYDTTNDYAAYKSLIEEEIGEPGDWEEYGFLLPGAFQIPAALALMKDHPRASLATFDTNTVLYDALERGEILFGIDQQPYLQGYLPIPILTNAISSGQYFIQHAIKTGPTFVFSRPSRFANSCENDVLAVCEYT